MFDTGSAELRPYTKEILKQLAPVLNGVENKIGLSGHTDATPYAGGSKGYSNWELSADRANASRRELIAGGIDESKILRVVGLGSAVNLDRDNPNDPKNRRISIIVMNKATQDAVERDGAAVETSASAPLTPEDLQTRSPEIGAPGAGAPASTGAAPLPAATSAATPTVAPAPAK
jgi:chemotaxis protein MotB